MAALLGIDVGSASVRAGVFDVNGNRLAFAVKPIRQFHGDGGIVEQSSQDIWTQACAAVREAVAASGVSRNDIRGIGIDATCSLVAVGPGGSPIGVGDSGDSERNIVMWMDHRAIAEAAAINATRDPALAYVGGEVSVEMELPKLLWLKRRYPQRYFAAWRFFDLADYMVWRASGADVASVCTLGCKWNYLAHEQRFPMTLLEAVDLRDVLTKVPASIRPVGSAAGELHASAAREIGLAPGTIVATGIIDAHAGGLALVGERPEGSLALIGGTSNCHMLSSRDPVMVPGVWGPYYGAMVPGYWLNEGGQSAAGSLIDWTLRSGEGGAQARQEAKDGGRDVYAVVNEYVARLEAREPWPAASLHVLPDHHGNRSPRADPFACGGISGLTLEGGPDALARTYLATLQALAYGTRHIVDSMNAAGHCIRRVVMCGGGTKNPLLMREQADALGSDIETVREDDAVTLGAALVGGSACGAFESPSQAARAMVRPGGVVKARSETKAFHDAKYQVFLEMYDDQRRYRNRMASWR